MRSEQLPHQRETHQIVVALLAQRVVKPANIENYWQCCCHLWRFLTWPRSATVAEPLGRHVRKNRRS